MLVLKDLIFIDLKLSFSLCFFSEFSGPILCIYDQILYLLHEFVIIFVVLYEVLVYKLLITVACLT